MSAPCDLETIPPDDILLRDMLTERPDRGTVRCGVELDVEELRAEDGAEEAAGTSSSSESTSSSSSSSTSSD